MEKVVGQRLAMLKDRAFERRKRRVEFAKKFQKWLSVVPMDRLIKWYMDVDGNEMCIKPGTFFNQIPPEAGSSQRFCLYYRGCSHLQIVRWKTKKNQCSFGKRRAHSRVSVNGTRVF